MKLRNKIFISTSLLWIAFLLSLYIGNQFYFHAPFYYLFFTLAVGTLFLLVALKLSSWTIAKKIEKIKTDLAKIHTPQQRLLVEGNDELAILAKHINQFLSRFETASQSKKDVPQPSPDVSTETTPSKRKEHLVQLTHYDDLTSLPNRIFFNEMLNKSINHAKRLNKSLALLFIDLDHFKTINETHGTTVGDLILKEMALRFSSVIRTDDSIARLGGDEFIILLADILNGTIASSVAEKILQICKNPIHINNQEFFLSTSIGISIFPNDGETLEDLQKHADMAMHKAKTSQGNNFKYYQKAMEVYAQQQQQLQNALRQALELNEFVLYYQPKYSLEDGIIRGVEALIRWENPSIGFLTPEQFIPFAEESDLIIKIGEWTLHQACQQAKKWQQQGFKPLTIAINISPKQLEQPDFVPFVKSILSSTELDPHYLEIEITESTIMSNLENTTTKIQALRAVGISIAIDDFGTGYTSIHLLKHLPINTLKIDQSFIKGIPQNQNDIAITHAIITLAHSLHMKVTAEGVEHTEQLQFLAEQECDLVQGYYLSRPLSEKKLLLQLSRNALLQT